MPEEKYDIIRSMMEKVYVDMKTGQLIELVPKPGFKCVLEGIGVTESPTSELGDFP